MNRRAAATLTTAALLTTTAAAAVAFPALTARPGPAPALTATADAAITATADAAQATRGTIDAAALTDPAAVKAAALAAGRPETAWDRNCIAWSLDDATTGQFATDVAGTWLDAHGADCPDAIQWPAYYVETFAAGGPGEVVVTLDDEALADYYVDPYSDRGLQMFGFSVFDATRAEHSDLEAVTVTVEGTDRTWTTTTDQHDGGRITVPPPPHMRNHMP